jgi:hypothetical protein
MSFSPVWPAGGRRKMKIHGGIRVTFLRLGFYSNPARAQQRPSGPQARRNARVAPAQRAVQRDLAEEGASESCKG